jgi:hypothetical protein
MCPAAIRKGRWADEVRLPGSLVVVRVSHAFGVLAVLLILGQVFGPHLRGADLRLLAVSPAIGGCRGAGCD